MVEEVDMVGLEAKHSRRIDVKWGSRGEHPPQLLTATLGVGDLNLFKALIPRMNISVSICMYVLISLHCSSTPLFAHTALVTLVLQNEASQAC